MLYKLQQDIIYVHTWIRGMFDKCRLTLIFKHSSYRMQPIDRMDASRFGDYNKSNLVCWNIEICLHKDVVPVWV